MISSLIEKKRMSVLKVFLENKKNMYLNEIAKEANVPPSTCLRILNEMLKHGLIKQTNVSRLKLYSIDHDKGKHLESLLAKDQDPLDLFVNEASKEQWVKRIVLHGKDEDKANVLLIGNNMRSENIKIIAANIREEYGFTVSYMMLTHEQFSQMKELNLFKGKLEELYRAPL